LHKEYRVNDMELGFTVEGSEVKVLDLGLRV
jgi:hypothetical protein